MIFNNSSSGWKGTLLGVAMATVTTMVTKFGCHVNNILVVVGPSVGVCCFKLDRDQVLDFSRIHPGCVPDPESTRPHVNIRLANRCNTVEPQGADVATVSVALMRDVTPTDLFPPAESCWSAAASCRNTSTMTW